MASSRTTSTCLGALLALLAAGVPSVRAEQPTDFDRVVKPLLAKHCVSCHGAEKPKGDLRLDGPAPDLVNPKVRATWEKVHSMLVRGEMPPSEKTKLTTDELDTLTTWIRLGVERGVLADRGGAGRTTMRRLTRVEYARMLQDVLGLHFSNVPIHLWEKLPNDPQAEAPLNDGDLLNFQSLHLKTYVELTEKVVSAVLAPETRPTPLTYRIDPRSLTQRVNVSGFQGGDKGFGGKVAAKQADVTQSATVSFGVTERNADDTFSLPPIYRIDGYLGRDKVNAGSCYLELPLFPKSGVLHVRIRAAAVIPKGEGAPVLRVALHNNVVNQIYGKEIASFPVTNSPDKLRDYDVEIPLDLLDFPWVLFERSGRVSLRITNDYMPITDRVKPVTEKGKPQVWPWQEPMLVLDQIEVNGPGTLAWPPHRHQAFLAAGDKLTDEKERASAILTEVASKAWRRPVTAEEVAPFVKLYRSRRKAGDSRDGALLQPLTAVLVSPFAIYIVERKAEKVAPLTDLELANRLSMFLWGRGPDAELLKLAEQKKLHDPKALAAQVDRMLDDPRSQVFTEDFVRRLLALERVENDPIDFGLTLRSFTNAKVADLREQRLKHDLAREPVRHFEHVLKNNRPLHELIGSDYLLVNDRLASYYGIAGVTGGEFRTVPAPAERRAGWLTTAGVVAAASRGNKEATIHRGVYLLQRFLGEHPGTPPGNVEPLEVQAKADAKRKQLSVREQVKLHTSINTCQLCHRKIDPLGFVWADLDYLGQKITPKPIKPNTPAPIADCSGKVPDGRTFANLAEFTALLKDEQANSRYQFGDVLLRHLMGYALARPVGLHDEAEIRELVRSARRDGWRLREVIKSITLSKSFTHG